MPLKKLISFNLFASLNDTIEYFNIAKVDKKFIMLGAFLSFLLMLVNLYSVSLLFPLANSLITKDFSILAKQPLIGSIVSKFPNLFSDPLILFSFFGLWLYGTIILKSALKYALFICTNEQSKKASLLVREAIFNRYLLFGKRFYDNTTISHLNHIMLNSTKSLKMQLDLINNIVVEVSSLLVSLGIMRSISWKLTILVFLVVPIHIVLSKKAKKGITTLSSEQAVAERNFTDKLIDILNCMPLVKGFSQEAKELDKFSKVNAIEVKKDTALQRRMQLFQPVQEILSTTTTLIVAGAMGFLAISDPTITAANAIVFLYLLLRVNPNLTNISNFDTRLASISPQSKMLKEIFDDTDKYIIKGGEREFNGLKNKIEIKNLNFSYEPTKKVLEGVSFEIIKGDKVALIGPSGVGKTTIINLLLRFYDCPKESIFIDGIDINEYQVSQLKSKMAFVSQDLMLFNDTIEANILYSNPTLSKEKLKEIFNKTILNETINSLKDKEQTLIGEKGANLSGGEKQRIALARALAKDAEIIILDEPTSSLDPKTEEKISELMQTEFKEKTVIVIAHRPAILQKVNKIAVLNKGKIIEFGTKKELEEKNVLKDYFKQKTN
ncbi:MAG: ABC transporter ATP-binding protein [Candidatus ainarchaeum sp.]|nr:ABC transporter ATP-binding protein [Candidatus ainarchaeum sp.]